MSIKILTQNSIDNTNIDGARQNHFSAGMRSGIVKGAFNEGKFFASSSNVIALDSCELRISGHQIVIDSIEAITLNNKPTTPTKYSMIAEVQVSDTSVPNFRLFIQSADVVLKQDNLFKTNKGNGTYQLRIGNFILGTTGIISDVVRTADLITGGGEGGVADIKFNATATQLSSSSQPEVNADYNEETEEWDLSFGIPAGSGSKVTIGGVEQPSWSADFVEEEKEKSITSGAIIHSGDVGTIVIRPSAENRIETTEGVVGNLYSVGNINELFTLNNDNVVINYNGVLETSGFIQFYVQTSGTRVFFDFYLNGTQLLPQSYKDFIGRNGYTDQMPIVNHLVNVKQGDVLTFKMKTNANYGSLQVNSRIVLKGYKL